MDGFHWPHHPRTQMLRDFLDSGEIGPIRRIGGAFTFRMAELDLANIRLQPELGGGSLLDVGCYPIYGIRWAMQAEPVRVWATAHYVNGVDVEMTGTLWFADGRIASFDCGFTHPYRGWLEITGTTGTVFVHDMWLPAPQATFEVRRDGKPARAPEVHADRPRPDPAHAREFRVGGARAGSRRRHRRTRRSRRCAFSMGSPGRRGRSDRRSSVEV